MIVTLKEAYQLTVRQYRYCYFYAVMYIVLSGILLFDPNITLTVFCATSGGIIIGIQIRVFASFSSFYTTPNIIKISLVSAVLVSLFLSIIPSLAIAISSNSLQAAFNLFGVASLITIFFLYASFYGGSAITGVYILLVIGHTFGHGERIYGLLIGLPSLIAAAFLALSVCLYFQLYRTLSNLEWTPESLPSDNKSGGPLTSLIASIFSTLQKINMFIDSSAMSDRTMSKTLKNPEKVWQLSLLGDSTLFLGRLMAIFSYIAIFAVYISYSFGIEQQNLLFLSSIQWYFLLFVHMHEPAIIRNNLASTWLRSSEPSRLALVRRAVFFLIYRSLRSSFLALAVITTGFIIFGFNSDWLNLGLTIICAYPGYLFLSFTEGAYNAEKMPLYSTLNSLSFLFLGIGVLAICIWSKLLLALTTVVLLIAAAISIKKWFQLDFEVRQL